MGGSYPAYIPCDSNRGWHGEWFYIRNSAAVPFLAFTGGRPEKQDSWSWVCAHKEKKKVEVIKEELRKIIRHGLHGVRVFHTLYRRRVAPLAERTRPMWMYSGPSDLDHASPEELPDDEVWSRLGRVLQLKPKERVKGKPAPFNSVIVSRLVCSLLFHSCFFLCFSYFLISGHPFCRGLEFTCPGRTITEPTNYTRLSNEIFRQSR